MLLPPEYNVECRTRSGDIAQWLTDHAYDLGCVRTDGYRRVNPENGARFTLILRRWFDFESLSQERGRAG